MFKILHNSIIITLHTHMASKSSLTYAARAKQHPNLVARRLFELAEEKKSNVVVSADLTTTKELLYLADRKYTSS